MAGVRLSILVPTLHSRREGFERLLAELRGQVDRAGREREVEILWHADDGTLALGAKRNELVARARGDYVCFLDDDDEISDRYVELVLGALDGDPAVDCVGIRSVITFRGRHPREMVHSTRYRELSSRGGVYTRPPYALNPIRREIADRYPYAEVDVGEDLEFALRLARDGALRSERFVDEVLYHYRSRRRYGYQWLLDRTEPVRHRLGLVRVNGVRARRALARGGGR